MGYPAGCLSHKKGGNASYGETAKGRAAPFACEDIESGLDASGCNYNCCEETDPYIGAKLDHVA